jgi:DNA-binding GntR family transcriptional regulator
MVTLETPPSLKDLALAAIREAILSHRFKPGEIYSEQAVGKELGISKTPIHQALQELERRRFVRVLPRRGFIVQALDEKGVRDLFEFRIAMEKLVFQLVMSRGLPPEAIAEIAAGLDEAAGTHDADRFVKLDLGFHRRLTAITDNPFLIDSLETIWDMVDWVGNERFHLKDGAKHALAEHRAIFESLKSGDAENALKALEHHLRRTEEECVAAIQSRKTSDYLSEGAVP